MSATATREGSEIVEFDGFSVEYRDASHRYWIIQGEERKSAISVTSALKVLDKPSLIGWAEKMGAEGALRLERAGELHGIPVEEAVNIVRLQKMGADAKRDAGADRGTAVHEALRIYCQEGHPPKLGDFPEEVRGYVQGLCRWLLVTSPEPILVEQIIGSVEHGFAGRFDLLAKINGETVLVDLKTSGRVYPEHHLQTAAYTLALEECRGERPDTGIIVAVGGDGSFLADRSLADDEDYLSVLACHRTVNRVRSAIRLADRATEAVAK